MKATLKTWVDTTKHLLFNPGALAIFAVLYALLLGSLYGFIATREATIWQVLVTFTLMAVVPALFFIFQAAIIDHARDQRFRWRVILNDALKFFVVTIPILLLAWLISYLLNKWQVRYPPPQLSAQVPTAPPKIQPIYWPGLIFATVRFVLFGVLLPLTAIHLWIALAGQEVRALFAGGAKPVLQRIGETMSRAMASESVFVYALGLLIFVVIPYAILFLPIPVKGTKTDFAVFILRLVVAFVFTLIGWLITITALSKMGVTTAPQPVTTSSQDQVVEAPA
jgi:hypothetical protein